MKCISKALVGGFYALFLFVPAASDARGLPSRASVDIEAEMAFDALLSRVAQKTLDQYRMKTGSQAPDQAVARFDVSTGSVTVELRGWLPETGGAELEDLQGQLMNEVLDQARLIYPASGIEFRYNGRSFEEHYPEEAAADGVRYPLRWTSPVRARSSVARALAAGQQARPGHRRIRHRAQPLREMLQPVPRIHEFPMRVVLQVTGEGRQQRTAVPQGEVPRPPTPFRSQAAVFFKTGQKGMAYEGVAAIVQGIPRGGRHI